MLDKIQINNTISISSIIIIYEILILLLYFVKVLDISKMQMLISWPLCINIFIILVIFLTDCKLSNFTKFWVIILKIILLVIVLSLAKFSYVNYFISIAFLLIYFFISNINNVYNCNINIINLIYSLIISSVIYLFLNIIKNN
jgi:hypothetical protein